MNQTPESASRNKTREKLKALAIVIVCFIILLSAFAFPYIRDGYRFRRLTQSIEQGMSRAQVLKLAEEIGYHHKDIESKDGLIIPNPGEFEPGEMGDVFYFTNVLLYSFVAVRYDQHGKVSKIKVDP